jgi:hypothetical protein
MEKNLQAARQSLAETIASLETIAPTVNMNERMILTAVTPYTQNLQTTFGREVSQA